MPRFSTRRRVAFTAEQMFALVADVEQYPKFLPLCEALSVRERTRDAEGRDVLVAVMEAGYKAIRERFTSRVTLDGGANRILVTYLDGPFSRLDNVWTFVPTDDGCEVDFFIDYEFKSFVLQMLMGAMFDQAFRKFTDAFEARARQVYGSKTIS
jgi:coenzyme Q-binding protein COQ10